jgi:hypothetical protein
LLYKLSTIVINFGCVDYLTYFIKIRSKCS